MKKMNQSYKPESDFTFKCHREASSQLAYAVNSIAFNDTWDFCNRGKRLLIEFLG